MLAQNVLSPIFSRPAHWYLDEEAAQRILTDFQRASWQASTYALQSIARENLHPHLPAVHHPTLVIVGSRDTTVYPQPQAGEIFLNYHDGDEALVVLDGDHIFDVLATGPEVLDEAIFNSLAWFNATL